jgi:hypothetical protein
MRKMKVMVDPDGASATPSAKSDTYRLDRRCGAVLALNKSLELACESKLGEFFWLFILRRIFAILVLIVVIAIFNFFFSLCGDIAERDATSGTRNTQRRQLLRQCKVVAA